MSLFSAKKFAIMGCLLATVAHAHPSSDTTDIKHVVLNDMEVRAQAGKPVYRATTTLEWEIVHIKANLQFRFAEKTALVNECITTHPWCYATDCLVLDAPGVQVKGAKVLNGNTLKYTTEGDKLIVRLGKSYRMTDTLRLVLDYVAQPYSTPVNGSKAITEDRGLYFINTEGRNPYWPKQIWTQGETEANSHWLVCIDKPNCRFTTELALVVPDSLTTLSNGTLTSQKKSAGGLRTDTW
ncbi:MAG: hypothetical protein EBZ77_02915, partial [Chitinophagia bacterium]|nr:hypothetical protein [Chitinophagia bacterium]